MSLYKLNYNWQGNEGILAIDQEGILYLDLSEPKVRVYSNPTDGPMAVLTVTKKKIFLTYQGRAYELSPVSLPAGDLVISAVKSEEFFIDYRKYLDLALGYVRQYWKKPYVLGGAAFLFILIILVFSFTSEDVSESTRMEMELGKVAPDLSAQELAGRRLKLAESYLNEKNYTLSIDLADKILAYQPDNSLAIKIKEKALVQQSKAKTNAQKVLKQELRIKSLLDEAATLMARGDFQGAGLVVEQVLEDHPKHAEAYRMQENIKQELEKINEKKRENQMSDQQKVQDAERLWQDGKRIFEEEKYTEAWALLSSAYKIVQDLNIKPSFRIDLKELLNETESHLNQVVRPLVENARRTRNAGDTASGLAQISSYQQALDYYFKAEAAFAEYPLLKDEIDLTVRSLDNAVNTHFVEAQTILGLEGCCAAESYFQKVMTLAKYDRVPLYLKAKQFLEQCPCR